MSLFKKIFSGGDNERVDYYQEGLELLKVGKVHEPLTCFRLALRDNPRDTAVLPVKGGRPQEPVAHLRTLLRQPASGSQAERHIACARQTLAETQGDAAAGEGR